VRQIQNLDLTEYNSYRIKTSCANAFFPNTEEDLLTIFKERLDTKKHLLGNGNNIILSKPYYQEDFIIFNGCFEKVEVDGTEIAAEAGATMLKLSEIALQHSLTGVEIFYDIPSSVGGAVVMNAGASGEEIKDVLLKVRYLDLADMQVKEINNEKIEFEYRNSFFHKYKDKIVLKAWFNLIPGERKKIKTKMELIKKSRWAKQPREYPNSGSVFKRPEGFYVGALIDSLGLKGQTIGGAKVSEKHAGFIINHNNAIGEDILKLIDFIKYKVKENIGIDLELEQRII